MRQPVLEMEKAQGRSLLKRMLGPQAEFRPGQWEAVDLVAHRRQRLLVVQCTGWGKSTVYFLATKILREGGAGPTLLVSPLLALMRNQILAAEKLGIRAATIHSENLAEWAQIEAALEANQVDLLMVSPERLGNAEFLQRLLPLIQGRIGMFVVDEAHCISDWGHDFRPDYRRIVRLLRLLPANVPVLGTTATANDRVVGDVQAQIANLHILRGPLVRPSLKLYNIQLHDQADRLAWLANFLPQLPGSGIIYTLTVQDARRVAGWLQQRGLAARAYHADLEPGQRVTAECQLLNNEVKALVSTVALGMGFDKPDLGFVVHFQRPGSVVAYYQQVGRAGRAMDSAFGILLSGREDDEIQNYFINTAFPPLEVMLGVLDVLKKRDLMTLDEIGAELNHSRNAIEKALKLLEVDGAVQREGASYARTANPWQPDVQRFERVTQHRRTELEEIKRYVEHPGCLMEFLARALDDPTAAPCGKCMNCTGNTTRRQPPVTLVQEAADFLRSDSLVLEPHWRWPRPALAEVHKALPDAVERFESGRPKSVIPEQYRAQEGRVLCIFGDAGWGRDVARGKYETGVFSDALVVAAARLILEKWKPAPPPGWLTAVPSRRHSALVHDFAQRLGARLELPFLPVLRARNGPQPQKQMQNRVQQVRNVLQAFQFVPVVVPDSSRTAPQAGGWPELFRQWLRRVRSGARSAPPLPPAPVLLVDDMVDSGWTMTVAAVLLRQHGSGPVYPFALAKASPRGG